MARCVPPVPGVGGRWEGVRMSAATAADYGWIRSSFVFPLGIEVGYCLTLVRGVPPEEVLRVMSAEPRGGCRDAKELFERRDELVAESDEWDESFLAGVCAVPGEGGDWTLVLHFDGGIGMRPRFLEVLSTGSRAVTHASNGGRPIHTFAWYEDGELRTGFEWPTVRHGSAPDDLVPLMREAGFDMGEEADADTYDRKAAVLALAERLTGARPERTPAGRAPRRRIPRVSGCWLLVVGGVGWGFAVVSGWLFRARGWRGGFSGCGGGCSGMARRGVWAGVFSFPLGFAGVVGSVEILCSSVGDAIGGRVWRPVSGGPRDRPERRASSGSGVVADPGPQEVVGSGRQVCESECVGGVFAESARGRVSVGSGGRR
ncbi:DUF6461 domain-containing protein [Embleya sp. NPDC059237]|uniref:DUF6461 domain-containing protein n=1 Tax=Embleya sp. NPDC059237 TaxID=3346784 RepID=UPI0036B2E097